MVEDTKPVPSFLSITDVAARLGLTRDTVYRQCKAGKIPAVRQGRLYIVPASYLNELETKSRETKGE